MSVEYGPGPRRTHERGGMALTATTPVTLTNAGQWYPIPGMVETTAAGFVVAAGIMTYNGAGGTFLFTGSSDLSASAGDKITYGLAVNGIVGPLSQTPHTFTSSAKTEGIAITAPPDVATGDTLAVWAKSMAGGTTITVETLSIVFWGA